MIRIEFWNGQLNKKGELIKTKHNPCLWSNVNCDEFPWRRSYINAVEVLDRWINKEMDDTTLLHHLRFIAYGLGKRDYDDCEVVWWGNMTPQHTPKLVVENYSLCSFPLRGDCEKKFTLYFRFEDAEWRVEKIDGEAEFYWGL